MTTTTPESRGRIAYTAYCRKVGFRGINGDELPSFDDLPDAIREAWIGSAGVIWDLATTGKATI
jgi:hypothetical protein